jgi:hypothetical protein
VSIYTVIRDWVKVVDPGDTADLAAPDQRELCADVFTEEPDHLYDAFSETLVRNPSLRVQLIEAFRHGDFMQVGAVFDRVCRDYVIGSPWLEMELRDAQEKETFYRESY